MQEFLNKHAGMVVGFEKTVEEGVFKGYVGSDKVRIVLEKSKIEDILFSGGKFTFFLIINVKLFMQGGKFCKHDTTQCCCYAHCN